VADLSDIPTDQLIQALQAHAAGTANQSQQPQQQASLPQTVPNQTVPNQTILNQTPDNSVPQTAAAPATSPDTPIMQKPSLMGKVLSGVANTMAPIMAGAQDSLAGRALASLPMGAVQFVTDNVGNHEIPLTHYLMPDDKNISTGDISNSILNVTKDTNAKRAAYDASNPSTSDWATERAGELILQGLQGGFAGKAFAPLQFASEASPILTKAAQYLTNIGAGAGIGAGFGAIEPQTQENPDARNAERGNSAIGSSLFGGALSGIAPALTGAYSAVANRVSPLLQAAKRLQTVVGADNIPDFVSAIDKNAPTAASIPGYQPTTAQLAENPGMATLERGARSPASPFASDIGGQDIHNRKAISDMFSGINPANQSVPGPWGDVPSQPGDIAALRQEAAAALNTAQAKIQAKLTSANNLANTAGKTAQQISAQAIQELPQEDTGDISAQLNEKLLPQYNNDRQVKNDLFNNIDPDGTVPVGTGKLKETLQTSLGNISSQYARDAATPALADEIMTLPDTISFKQLQEYRPVLSDEIQKARLAGDGLKAKVLGDLKASLESYTPDIAQSQLPEHVDASNRAQNAMDFYQNTFAPKWKNGPGKQFAQGVNTYNPVAPETVASKFIRPGNVGANTLRNLNNMVADDPTIQPIIEKYVLGELQQQKGLIDDNGIINPDRIDSWMQKNNQTLKMNPELQNKVANMRDAIGTANETSDNMAQALKQRQSIYTQQQKALNDSSLSNLLNTENTRSVVSSALSSDTPVKNVKSLINLANQDQTGKAMKGLKQATYDHLKEDLTNVQARATQDATLPLSMAKLDTYLDNPAKTNALKMIIGDDGLQRLTAAKTGLQLMNTMSNFQSIPGSATSENIASATGLAGRMLKGASDMINPGTWGLWKSGMLQTNKALQGRIGAMMQKAVVDPQFAKTLATYTPPKRFVKMNSIINSMIPQSIIGEQIGQSQQQ